MTKPKNTTKKNLTPIVVFSPVVSCNLSHYWVLARKDQIKEPDLSTQTDTRSQFQNIQIEERYRNTR